MVDRIALIIENKYIAIHSKFQSAQMVFDDTVTISINTTPRLSPVSPVISVLTEITQWALSGENSASGHR